MDALIERAAGLNVHQGLVVACVILGAAERRPTKEVRSFGTMRRDLMALRKWLLEKSVTHVGMEGTGVYWQPVHVALEGDSTVIVGNASHMRNVPGRRTDVKDAEWIADLVRHGLVRASFVAPPAVGGWHELVRHRNLGWTALARGALPKAGRDGGMVAAVEPKNARCHGPAGVTHDDEAGLAVVPDHRRHASKGPEGRVVPAGERAARLGGQGGNIFLDHLADDVALHLGKRCLSLQESTAHGRRGVESSTHSERKLHIVAAPANILRRVTVVHGHSLPHRMLCQRQDAPASFWHPTERRGFNGLFEAVQG